ncbi:MAG TPA: L,D-transpeptidase [Candidatus Sulfotelmatobacter sp.]|nr:L,D-transpeptidase [Candidatus Sulfotelmatobacter sp.]
MERRAGGGTAKRTQKLILAALTLATFSAVATPSLAPTSPAQTSLAPSSPAQSSLAESPLAQSSTPDSADRGHRVVLVSIPDRKLAVLEGGNVIATFSVAVGAAWSPSPTGEFQIVSRVVNPIYYHHGSVVPSGKDNPVGTRWLGLSRPRYGIHGTNAPKSIGHAASHGCIRLRNRDIEQLFTMLQVGDSVEIRGERDQQVGQIFGSGTDDSTVAAAQVPGENSGQ